MSNTTDSAPGATHGSLFNFSSPLWGADATSSSSTVVGSVMAPSLGAGGDVTSVSGAAHGQFQQSVSWQPDAANASSVLMPQLRSLPVFIPSTMHAPQASHSQPWQSTAMLHSSANPSDGNGTAFSQQQLNALQALMQQGAIQQHATWQPVAPQLHTYVTAQPPMQAQPYPIAWQQHPPVVSRPSHHHAAHGHGPASRAPDNGANSAGTFGAAARFNADAPPFQPTHTTAAAMPATHGAAPRVGVQTGRAANTPAPAATSKAAAPQRSNAFPPQPAVAVPATSQPPPAKGKNAANVGAAAAQPMDIKPPNVSTAAARDIDSGSDNNSTSAKSMNGNGICTPSVEPLLSLVGELSQGLVLRPMTHCAPATTPIDGRDLVGVIELTYGSFTTDSDLMNFVKKTFPIELCLQLRDYLSCDDAERGEESLFARDFTAHRGTFVVSLIEVLGTLPSPCTSSHDSPDVAGGEFTSYCPLMKCVMKHFDSFTRTQRGCIGLLRVISSTANAPRPVDRLVRQVTSRLEYLVFDSHANYIVSHVLCGLDEWIDERAPRYVPIDADEMRNRTASILALASWGREGSAATSASTSMPSSSAPINHQPSGCPYSGLTVAPAVVVPASGCSKVIHGAVPPRRAMASPQVWRGFIVQLCKVLGDSVSRVGTHKEASHILEHAVRRVPFGKIPDALPLLHRIVEDVEGVLVPLCHSPCGRHIVQALAETLATKSSGMKFATVSFCVQQLDSLRTTHRHLAASSPYFERIEAALRRLPSFSAAPSTKPATSAMVLADAYDY